MNESSNPNAEKKIELRINGQVFVTTRRPLSGFELRQLPTPPLRGDFDLYQVAPGGGADIVVADEQLIDFDSGTDFFSTPRTILAGFPPPALLVCSRREHRNGNEVEMPTENRPNLSKGWQSDEPQTAWP